MEKANGLVRIEPGEKMPVFRMFAVYEDDCKIDNARTLIINLSDDKKTDYYRTFYCHQQW